MIRYSAGKRGKIRVYRARKNHTKRDKARTNRSSLLIRLRGWDGVFKFLDAKWRKGKRPYIHVNVRVMTPTERKEFLNSRKMKKRFWYTRCYMIGKGGLYRKLAIKQRLIRPARPRPAPGVVRRKKLIRNKL